MPNPNTTNIIPSYSGYDWSGTAGADSTTPGMGPPPKKKRRRRADDPIAPVQTGRRSALDASPGLGGMAPPSGSPSGTDPNTFNNSVSNVTMRAPAGSAAAGFPSEWTNPFALPAAAQNPMIVANDMMSSRYGLPAGSATAGELANIFNPYDKILGLGMDRPTSNVDWVNLGASLMGGPQGTTGGAQLDPKSLMTNMVSAIVNEVNSMKSGGKGYSGGGYNPLAELAHMDPMEALQSFSSMVQGMLSGTMPDNEIQGFTNYLMRVGQQFAQSFYHGDSAQQQADGASFITALVQQLGPSLGL